MRRVEPTWEVDCLNFAARAKFTNTLATILLEGRNILIPTVSSYRFCYQPKTLFDMTLLNQCKNILFVGAVAFATFSASYNHQFG